MSRKLYRVAEPGAHVITDPDSGHLTVPDPRRAYAHDHPLVKAYPWLFISDEDRVEDASSAPGRLRHIPRGEK